MKFLSNILSTLIGLCIFSGLAFILFVAVVAAAGSSTGKASDVKANSVLMLDFAEPISEIGEDNPFGGLNLPIGDPGSISLIELKAALKKAKADENIKGVFLKLSDIDAGYAVLQEIRDELVAFRESGKFIHAYGEYFSEKAYYLASTAERISLTPIGAMEFNGLTSQKTFYKNMLEKLGVKPVVFKVGEYKSAVEPYLLDKMSDASRSQTESYLNSLYDFYLKNVSLSRGIALEELTLISDSMKATTVEEALKHKLITHAEYYDEAEKALKTKLGLNEDKKIEFVSLDEYTFAKGEDESSEKDKIAVIVAQGDIVSGRGEKDEIGSDSFVKQIKKAREDKNVKAIVLRINSPGGSALASDVMWREITLTTAKKPVIASMSDVAASGGYYMAMGCTKIVAQPNTITGSIGIFGLWMNLRGLMEDKIGLTSDRVNTGGFSDIGDPTREMTETEAAMFQANVERGYEVFTSKAAAGRKMDIAELKSKASGRVWSGAEALREKLVDQLGGLDDAIALAAKEAKLAEGKYGVRYLPGKKNIFDRLMDMDALETAKTNFLKEELGSSYKALKTIKQLEALQGPQARLPFEMEVK